MINGIINSTNRRSLGGFVLTLAKLHRERLKVAPIKTHLISSRKIKSFESARRILSNHQSSEKASISGFAS
jgi:hypothetical protein